MINFDECQVSRIEGYLDSEIGKIHFIFSHSLSSSVSCVFINTLGPKGCILNGVEYRFGMALTVINGKHDPKPSLGEEPHIVRADLNPISQEEKDEIFRIIMDAWNKYYSEHYFESGLPKQPIEKTCSKDILIGNMF